MSKQTTEQMAQCDEATVEEVDQLIADAQITNFDKVIAETPALKDAYEKVKTIRALTEKNKPTIQLGTGWEFLETFRNIEESATTENPALKEAWEAYYMIKALVQK